MISQLMLSSFTMSCRPVRWRSALVKMPPWKKSQKRLYHKEVRVPSSVDYQTAPTLPLERCSASGSLIQLHTKRWASLIWWTIYWQHFTLCCLYCEQSWTVSFPASLTLSSTDLCSVGSRYWSDPQSRWEGDWNRVLCCFGECFFKIFL